MIVRATGYNNQSMISSMMQQQSKLFNTYTNLNNNVKFSNISENPMDSGAIISLNNQLSMIATYKNNITTAKTQINVQDDAFTTINTKLDRINELSILVANGASGDTGVDAAKNEIKQLKESIVNIANTQYNGQYIFSGANVGTQAYTLEADGSIKYHGTPSNDPTSERKVDIAEGVKIGVNASGDQVFGEYDAADPTKSTGLFKVLGELEVELNANPVDGDKIRTQLGNLQNSIKDVSRVQDKYSTNVAKLDMTTSTHDSMKINLTSQVANLQEPDMSEAISQFMNQNYAYQASMQAYMMMQNNSLMKFM